MAAAATIEQRDWNISGASMSEAPVYLVSQLESDQLVRARAEHFIGSVVAGTTFEISYSPEATTSLMDAARKAHEGDVTSRKMININVHTDVIERSIKAGHIMSVNQEVDKSGHIRQHGQTGQSIQANSLRFASQNPNILERTKPETRNLFRLEDLYRQGLLEDYVFVVLSRAPDNLSLEEMHEEGFFVDTMSIAIQATTSDGHGGLPTESAFVAGKRHRDAPRHDIELVRRLGARFGIDVTGLSASQTIDTPWLIPKHMIPNGVIDLVRLADEAMGGTFFGQDKPQQDYLAYKSACLQRELELEPIIQDIVGELIKDAPTFRNPVDATRRLHELSEEKLVRLALVDEHIDVMVFGIESAHYLQAARHYLEIGDLQKVDHFMARAEASADTDSCPGGGLNMKGDSNNTSSEGSRSSGVDADCEYTSKKCPLCNAKNVKTTDKKLVGNKRRIEGSCGCKLDYTRK